MIWLCACQASFKHLGGCSAYQGRMHSVHTHHAQCAHTPDAEDACLVYYMPPSYVCRVSYTHLDRCAYVGACRVWVRRVWVRRVWVRRVWVRRVWVLRVWVLLGITVHAEKLGVLCCLMYDMPGGLHALLPYALDALSRKTKQAFH